MRLPLWRLQRRLDTQKKSVFAFVEGKHNKALSEFSLEITTALTYSNMAIYKALSVITAIYTYKVSADRYQML